MRHCITLDGIEFDVGSPYYEQATTFILEGVIYLYVRGNTQFTAFKDRLISQRADVTGEFGGRLKYEKAQAQPHFDLRMAEGVSRELVGSPPWWDRIQYLQRELNAFIKQGKPWKTSKDRYSL